MLLQILGRLHILILHLPIGILLLTALMEWLNHWKKKVVSRELLSFQYAIGSITALGACVTGYTLSISGDYGEDVVKYHMWSGITATIISMMVCWASYSQNLRYIRWGALLMLITISVTGHLGGTITHGEDFFTFSFDPESTEIKRPQFEIDDVHQAQIYTDLIKPILDAKCVSCHGSSKKKGKLRLDSEESLHLAGKSGKPLIGTDPEESEMIKRIELPMADKKHMPPKKKMQITSEELQLIKWWIGNGSQFQKTLKEVAQNDTSVYQIVADILAENKGENAVEINSVVPAFLPKTTLVPLSKEIMEELVQLDIVALPAGENSPFLEINTINVREMKKEHWELLTKIAPHIVRLKLSQRRISNDDLINLSNMKNLLRLYIDDTKITDEGLKHLLELPYLHYLNINNTAISDKGVSVLTSLSNLRNVYAFQTNINMDVLPNGAKIEKGGFQLPVLESDTVRIK